MSGEERGCTPLCLCSSVGAGLLRAAFRRRRPDSRPESDGCTSALWERACSRWRPASRPISRRYMQINLWERACPRRRPASRPISHRYTKSPVRASLLAIAVGQSTPMLNVMPPSRASSLPQGICSVLTALFKNRQPLFLKATPPCVVAYNYARIRRLVRLGPDL